MTSNGLDGFEPATPELLAKRVLMRRSDSKFIFPQDRLTEILPRLGADYALLRAGDRCVTTYRSLYFDTPQLRCFDDHRRGRRVRQKVRVRHYPDRNLSFLEVKTRRSDVLTVKHRLDTPYGEDQLGTRELEFLSERCTLAADTLAPQVWTNFSRITLLGIHTNERVTIDLELEVVRHARRVLLGSIVILEVKQFPFCGYTPVMSVLREARLRPISVSKYCTALALTCDGLRVNRLMPSLRAVERLRA